MTRPEIRSAPDAPPRSVINLWHTASISHRDIVNPALLLAAIRAGGGQGDARRSLGIAIQESEAGELVDLMIDKVIDGRGLHALLASLDTDGSTRRSDLVEWSKMFT